MITEMLWATIGLAIIGGVLWAFISSTSSGKMDESIPVMFTGYGDGGGGWSGDGGTC